MGVPSPATPTTSTFRPEPAESIVAVISFGAGPGLNLDFATLSFHVPFAGSLSCASATPHHATTTTPARSPGTHRRRRRLIATSVKGIAGAPDGSRARTSCVYNRARLPLP